MSNPPKSSPVPAKKDRMESYTLTDEGLFHASVCGSMSMTEDILNVSERCNGLSDIYNSFYIPMKHNNDIKGKFHKQVRLLHPVTKKPIRSLLQNKRYSDSLKLCREKKCISFLPRDIQDYIDETIDPQTLPRLIPASLIFAHVTQPQSAQFAGQEAVQLGKRTQPVSEVKQEPEDHLPSWESPFVGLFSTSSSKPRTNSSQKHNESRFPPFSFPETDDLGGLTKVEDFQQPLSGFDDQVFMWRPQDEIDMQALTKLEEDDGLN